MQAFELFLRLQVVIEGRQMLPCQKKPSARAASPNNLHRFDQSDGSLVESLHTKAKHDWIRSEAPSRACRSGITARNFGRLYTSARVMYLAALHPFLDELVSFEFRESQN